MKQPYVVASPPYDITSGGIKVMWGFYGWLLAKGVPAFMNVQIADVPTIGVYPEIVNGNPLNAGSSVRYILQQPGMMGGLDEFGTFRSGPTKEEYASNPLYANDEIYVFSRVYDEWQSDDEHILFLPIIDLHTFTNQHALRTKKAFYIGKGANGGRHPKDAIELTRTRAQDQEALAHFLNECETLYVYDRLSAIMECARLCGCKVVYLGDMPESQLKLYEPGMNGLGYGHETDLDTREFRSHYIALRDIFDQRLETFIDHTQK